MDVNKEKIYVLLEDDMEILGNGQGHVFYRQYLPVIRYVKLLKKYNLRSTFYVDMAHLLFLRKNEAIKDFGLQADYIEKIIVHLLRNDMEVQLHLHPQWLDARMENNEIKVGDQWNIGQLNDELQTNLVQEAYNHLKAIIHQTNIKNPITSFRPGSWGLQPFDTLYKTFENLGLKTVLGPIKDLEIPYLKIDYTNMESEIEPYYCDKSDINKLGKAKGQVIVPMTPTYLNWLDLMRYYLHLKLRDIKKRYDKDLDLNKAVLKSKYVDPTKGKDKITLSKRPFKTHLKMNAQPFWFLKKTFKRALKKIVGNEQELKLMVIETHSKDFKNTFDDIEKFFGYLTKEYHNLEFITANDLYDKIKKNKLKPLLRD
jgi:hypothetical protein